jgi:hypothetical protein
MFIFKLFRHTGALSRVTRSPYCSAYTALDTAFNFVFSLKIVCCSKFLCRDIFIYNVLGWCCGGCKCISVDSLYDFQFVALQMENLSWVWSMKTFHSQQELLSRERMTSCPTCIVVLIVESALCMLLRHSLFNSALSSLNDILPKL